MSKAVDDFSSRKISNTPSKRGVFEANSNINSNEVLNVNNLSNVNNCSTVFHADNLTNIVNQIKCIIEKN